MAAGIGCGRVRRMKLTLPHYVMLGLGLATVVLTWVMQQESSGALVLPATVVSALVVLKTIIGIPFGIQHLKLAGLALAPVGKTIVSKESADYARLYAAQAAVARRRS